MRNWLLGFSLSLILCCPVVHAADVYNDIKIKSRAKRGYDNHGAVRYEYYEVDEYSDELDPEEELGVLEIEENLRELHMRVNVRSAVDSEKEHMEIGTVRVKRGISVREIDNKVTIDGDITVKGGDASVGSVVLERSRSRRIKNEVEIKGSVDVE